MFLSAQGNIWELWDEWKWEDSEGPDIHETAEESDEEAADERSESEDLMLQHGAPSPRTYVRRTLLVLTIP